MVLPHDILFGLHESGRLAKLCPKQSLVEFWDNFKAHVSSHIQWPVAAERSMLPIGVHGDDCRYTESGQKLIIFSMNLLLDGLIQDRYPLFVIRVAACMHRT